MPRTDPGLTAYPSARSSSGVLYLTYRPANGFKRVMAFVIDVLPLFLAMYLVSVLGFGRNPLAELLAENNTAGHPERTLLLITAATLAIWIPYCAVAELSSWRGSFGKKIMGIRVCCCVDRDKRHLSLKQVLTRNAAKFLSAAVFSLGFLWAFFTNGNRAWHDSLSKTAVAER